MFERVVKDYNEAVFDTDRDRALSVIGDAVAQGISPEDIVFKIVVPAIEQMMSSATRSFDASLAQHFVASQIAAEVTETMVARFAARPESAGCVVIGTAAGDLHSLGKRIVIGCLKALMVEVHDLGVNVPAERFVDAAVEHGAQAIAISAMMAHTARGAGGSIAVRGLLRERGLEGRVKIVVGGAPFRFDDSLYKEVGADAWAEDGISAARVIESLVKGGA